MVLKPDLESKRTGWALAPRASAYVLFAIVWVLSHELAPTSGSPATARFQSVVLQICLVLSLPLLVSKALKLGIPSVFRLHPTSLRNLLLTAVFSLCSLFLLAEVGFLQGKLMPAFLEVEGEFGKVLRANSPLELGWTFVSMALVPAVCEEFLFRGFMLGRLSGGENRWQAIMVCSALFGLFHSSVDLLLSITLAGVALAYITIRSGSLYNAIVSHALMNTWSLIALNSDYLRRVPWIHSAEHVPFWLLGISLAGVIYAGRTFGLKSGPRNRGG